MTEDQAKDQGKDQDAPAPPVRSSPELIGTPEAQAALLTALAAARGEFQPVSKAAEGRFENRPINYATVDMLQRAAVPALSKHGLTLLQIPEGPDDSGRLTLHSWLTHGGGAVLKSQMRFAVPTEFDDQHKAAKRKGALITYMSRYVLKTLFQLDGGKEDDLDDAAHDAPRGTQKAPPSPGTQSASRRNNKTQSAAPEVAPSSPSPIEELKRRVGRVFKDGLGLSTPEEMRIFAREAMSEELEDIASSEEKLKTLLERAQLAAAEKSKTDTDDDWSAIERMSSTLGIAQRDGRAVRMELGRYAYAKTEAALDDIQRDAVLQAQLRAAMEADIKAGRTWS